MIYKASQWPKPSARVASSSKNATKRQLPIENTMALGEESAKTSVNELSSRRNRNQPSQNQSALYCTKQKCRLTLIGIFYIVSNQPEMVSFYAKLTDWTCCWKTKKSSWAMTNFPFPPEKQLVCAPHNQRKSRPTGRQSRFSELYGGGGWTWTSDQRIMSPLL